MNSTTRELVRTADRDAIERTICTQLSESDLYEVAWIGERALDSDSIEVRSTGGDDGGCPKPNAVEANDDGVIEFGAADRTMRTGEVQVENVDGAGNRWWQDAGEDCENESIAAGPLQHEETVDGVLVVHTSRKSAFSDREREDFEVCGRTIGFVVNAVKNHKLLFADTATELDLYATDTGSPFEAVARELDCELRLQGYVASGGRWVVYLEIDETAKLDLVDEVDRVEDVERDSVLNGSGGRDRMELTLAESAILDTLSHLGRPSELP